MKNTALQAEINTIPKNWEVVKLEDIIASFHNGIWGDDPLPNLISYPVIRSTEITCDGKIDLSTVAFRKIPEDKVNKFTLDDGDILLVASSGSPDLIGRAALFRQPDDDRVYLFSNFMLRIRSQTIDQNFLFYVLSSQHYYHFLKSLQQTSTGLRNLPKKNFLNFTIPYPPLAEQHKIAEILSTVDEAIEQVDKAIEKTGKLKKGLMQELLTKGIGHTKFKDTEIGRIPKDWEVVRIDNILSLEYGEGLTQRERIEGRYPVLGSNGIVGYNNKAIVTGPGIVVGRKGSIGAVTWVDEDFWPIDTTYYIRIVDNRCNLKWVYHKMMMLNLCRLNMATGVPGLNRELVYLNKIGIPTLNEQERTVAILDAMDMRKNVYEDRRDRFMRIKKGLMNDLLTGRKRVIVGGEI
ncbi:restriction endonuclease subunit S [candidate division WOR-3 bacterium]|nr:restriction endonuclease subunit S [candidate division WOR-3 bacterium]